MTRKEKRAFRQHLPSVQLSKAYRGNMEIKCHEGSVQECSLVLFPLLAGKDFDVPSNIPTFNHPQEAKESTSANQVDGLCQVNECDVQWLLLLTGLLL